MQSQVKFNRVPEKVPEKVPGSLGAMEKVPEKVPKKVMGGFGAEPGGSTGFRRRFRR